MYHVVLCQKVRRLCCHNVPTQDRSRIRIRCNDRFDILWYHGRTSSGDSRLVHRWRVLQQDTLNRLFPVSVYCDRASLILHLRELRKAIPTVILLVLLTPL